MDIIGLLVHLVISGIILGLFVWLAAKALGAPKASYYHGVITVICAVILGDVISYLIPGWFGTIVELLVILLLIKHFFGVGWIKAVVIAVLAVVIAIVLAAILALIGFAFFGSVLKGMIPGT